MSQHSLFRNAQMIDLLYPHKPCCKCREEIDTQAGAGVTWLGEDPYHSECAPFKSALRRATATNSPPLKNGRSARGTTCTSTLCTTFLWTRERMRRGWGGTLPWLTFAVYLQRTRPMADVKTSREMANDLFRSAVREAARDWFSRQGYLWREDTLLTVMDAASRALPAEPRKYVPRGDPDMLT